MTYYQDFVKKIMIYFTAKKMSKKENQKEKYNFNPEQVAMS